MPGAGSGLFCGAWASRAWASRAWTRASRRRGFMDLNMISPLGGRGSCGLTRSGMTQCSVTQDRRGVFAAAAFVLFAAAAGAGGVARRGLRAGLGQITKQTVAAVGHAKGAVGPFHGGEEVHGLLLVVPLFGKGVRVVPGGD